MMDDPKREPDEKAPEPPGTGDSVDDAAREAVEEIEKRGGHAGTGDIG